MQSLDPASILVEAHRPIVLVLTSLHAQSRLRPEQSVSVKPSDSGSTLTGSSGSVEPPPLLVPETSDPGDASVRLLRPLEKSLKVRFVSLGDLQRAPLSNAPLVYWNDTERQENLSSSASTLSPGRRVQAEEVEANADSKTSYSTAKSSMQQGLEDMAQDHLLAEPLASQPPSSPATANSASLSSTPSAVSKVTRSAGRSFSGSNEEMSSRLRSALVSNAAAGRGRLSPWCAHYTREFYRRAGASEREFNSHPIAYVTVTSWDESGSPETAASALFDATAPPQVFFDYAIDPAIPAVRILLGPDRVDVSPADAAGSADDKSNVSVEEARADAALSAMASAFGSDAVLMLRPVASWSDPLVGSGHNTPSSSSPPSAASLLAPETRTALQQFLRKSLLQQRAFPRLKTISAALSEYVAARRSKVSKLTAWVLGGVRGKSSRARDAAAAAGVPGLYSITSRANSNSGAAPPIEQVTRKLADTLLACGDYAASMPHYKAAASDFKTERQLAAYAAAAEMTDIAAFLAATSSSGSTLLATDSLSIAFSQYTRQGLHRNATRAAISLHLIRRASNDFVGAASACVSAADRLSTSNQAAIVSSGLVSPTSSSAISPSNAASPPPSLSSSSSSSDAPLALEALLQEQAGVCFAAAGLPRKAALRLAMASQAYTDAGLSVHAQRSCIVAHSIYAGRGWIAVDTKLAMVAALEASKLGDHTAAAGLFASVLSRPDPVVAEALEIVSTSRARRATSSSGVSRSAAASKPLPGAASSPGSVTMRRLGSIDRQRFRLFVGAFQLSAPATSSLAVSEPSGRRGDDRTLPLPLVDERFVALCSPDDQGNLADAGADPLGPLMENERQRLRALWSRHAAPSLRAVGLSAIPESAGGSPSSDGFSWLSPSSSSSSAPAQSPAASVGEPLAVTLRLSNPLAIPLNITSLHLLVSFRTHDLHQEEEKSGFADNDAAADADFDFHSSDLLCPSQDVTLPPRSWRRVQLLLQPKRQGTITVHGIRYSLSVPAAEDATGADSSVSVNGVYRLQNQLHVSVGPPMPLLRASVAISDTAHHGTAAAGGEIVTAKLSLKNVGLRPLNELWVAASLPFLAFPVNDKEATIHEGDKTIETNSPASVSTTLFSASGSASESMVEKGRSSIEAGCSLSWKLKVQAPASAHGRVSFRVLFLYADNNSNSKTEDDRSASSTCEFRLCATECMLDVGPSPCFSVIPMSLLPPSSNRPGAGPEERILLVRVRNNWRRTGLRLVRVVAAGSEWQVLSNNATSKEEKDGDFGLLVSADSSRSFTLKLRRRLEQGKRVTSGRESPSSLASASDSSGTLSDHVATSWPRFLSQFHLAALPRNSLSMSLNASPASSRFSSSIMEAPVAVSSLRGGLDVSFLWAVESVDADHAALFRLGMNTITDVYSWRKIVGVDLRYRRPRQRKTSLGAAGGSILLNQSSGSLSKSSVSITSPRDRALTSSPSPGSSDSFNTPPLELSVSAVSSPVPFDFSQVLSSSSRLCYTDVHLIFRGRTLFSSPSLTEESKESAAARVRLSCVPGHEAFGVDSRANFVWIGLTDVEFALEPGQNHTVTLTAGFFKPGVYNLNRFRLWVNGAELGWPRSYQCIVRIINEIGK